MKDNKFQYIIIGVFILAILIAVVVFSTSGKNKKNDTSIPQGTVVMWGTIPQSVIGPQIGLYSGEHDDYDVTYVQKNEATYANDLVEALASGKGPDMYLITPEYLWRFRDKITEVPFASYDERTFRNQFFSGAEVYLSEKGVQAFPFRVDPLVMYYNRTMLESNFVVAPPQFWDDMYAFVQSITKKNPQGLITDSALALGAWDNVNHAKDILSAMLLQSGVSVTTRTGITLSSTLQNRVSGVSGIPAASVVTFYSEFSNPVSLYYTWNEAKPNSLDAFIAGDVALYFGYASELPTIRAKNPNLDFDVAMLPQVESTASKATYGQIYGIALSKFTKNFVTAFTVAQELSSQDFAKDLFATDYATPPQKALLSARQSSDPYRSVFYQSTLISKSWIEPNNQGVDTIFRNMIKTYSSGELDAQSAVTEAHNALDLLIR